ncbi:hypothetical protein M3231_04745 [Neobacillus mesonae]|nr:hypothetical protein [Neobacillus mesonae]
MFKFKHPFGSQLVLLLLILVISACSDSTKTVSGVPEAIQVAEKYKVAELESSELNDITLELITEKQEFMQPLTTEIFFNRSVATRNFYHGYQLALIKESEVHVSNLEFTERNVAETQIELNYTGTLSLAEETLDLKGTIYLLKEADEWKVNNDVYNTEVIMNIFDENMLKHDERP